MAVTIHQITAVLNMPDEYSEQIDHAKKVIAASKANTYVKVPPANIETAENALTTFQDAATPAARRAALLPLRQSLQSIMFYFQQAANADPANAVSIVQSGSFKVKTFTPRQKGDFTIHNGVHSGTIDLAAEGSGSYTCHDWCYSPDGKIFVHLPPTVSAHTQVEGLTPGQYAYFTHELVTKDGGQGVSQIEMIMVQ